MIADDSSTYVPVNVKESVSGWSVFYKITDYNKHTRASFGRHAEYLELKIGAWALLLITNGYA